MNKKEFHESLKMELWELLQKDEQKVRDYINEKWIKGMITSSQAAHWALNCGDEGRVWNTYLRDKEMEANDKHGINFRLARKYSKGNPYRKLVNGKVTKDVEYISAMEESRYTIAQANAELKKDGTFAGELIPIRKAGEIGLAKPEKLKKVCFALNK